MQKPLLFGPRLTRSDFSSETLAEDLSADLITVNSNLEVSETLGVLEKELSLPACNRQHQYKCGKTERTYIDDTRLIHYVNGTVKCIYPTNVEVLYFSNGDSKTCFPMDYHMRHKDSENEIGIDNTDGLDGSCGDAGKVVYWYDSTRTMHTTFSDLSQVLEFGNGQVERVDANGVREIRFVDGVVQRVYPDGTSHLVNSQDNV